MRCISSEVSKLAMRKICLSAQGISGMKVQIGQKWEHMSCRMEEEIAWIPQNPMLDLAGTHFNSVTTIRRKDSENCPMFRTMRNPVTPQRERFVCPPKGFLPWKVQMEQEWEHTSNLLQGLSYCPSNFCHERCIRNKNGSIGWQRILSCNL